MKRALIVAGLFGGLATASLATRVFAEPPKAPQHRIVFELTSDDARAWEGVLNNVENVQRVLGPISIEVVVHGKGLAMLTTAKSAAVQPRMKQSADGGVVFAACENTMRRQNLKKEELVAFAHTVDSGVAEVVRKQESGWSYLRTGT
jgi:intracellular sulfur oxidation DsrE/DsrF family protein